MIQTVPLYGTVQKRSFSLGEYNISCQIFDDNSLISQENIRVIAWKYIKEETIYHYNKDGNLISSDYKYQNKGDDKFKKRKDSKNVRTYTNELEEHY